MAQVSGVRLQFVAKTISLAGLYSLLQPINDGTKLVLAVILGRTLLRFYNTPWLSGWNSEKIVFLCYSNSVPLKPLLSPCQGLGVDNDDDFSAIHPYPDILSLGIILLELNLQQSIEAFVAEDGIPYNERTINTRLILAVETFKKRQAYMCEGYRMAVNACLDFNFTEDVCFEEDSNKFRSQIYMRIVKPLEYDLRKGFGNVIDVNDLDKVAQCTNIQ